MKLRASFSALILLLGFCLGAPPAAAQQSCPPPPFSGSAKELEKNIFSEQQESDLGDAIAEHMQRSFRVIDDDIAATLRRAGENLLRQLPPTKIRIQFFLVDLPVVNAFAAPGGRVYVTRKLVTASRSEDELPLADSIATCARSSAVSIGKMCWTLSRWFGVSMKPPVPGVDASR